MGVLAGCPFLAHHPQAGTVTPQGPQDARPWWHRQHRPDLPSCFMRARGRMMVTVTRITR